MWRRGLSKWSPAAVSGPYRIEIKGERTNAQREERRIARETHGEEKQEEKERRDPLGSNKPAEVEVTLKLLHGYRPLFPYCSRSLKGTWPLYFFLCLPSVSIRPFLILVPFLPPSSSPLRQPTHCGPRNAARQFSAISTTLLRARTLPLKLRRIPRIARVGVIKTLGGLRPPAPHLTTFRPARVLTTRATLSFR